MTVLIDTNVVLSAALRDRLPELVVLYVATRHDCTWLVTSQIRREYIEVLGRPKFGFSVQVLARWTALLDMRTVNVGSPAASVVHARDPQDLPFLAAALATRADFLITGDKDLLELKGKVPTRIVTVAEFAVEFGIS